MKGQLILNEEKPIRLTVDEMRIIQAVSPHISLHRNEQATPPYTELTVKDIDGTKQFIIPDPVGILNVQKTQHSGQTDTYEFALSDGSTFAFSVVNEANGEAYAVGTRQGEPVSENDPTWHNNAKYYLEVFKSLMNRYPALYSAEADAPVLTERRRSYYLNDGIEYFFPIYEIRIDRPENFYAEDGALLAIKMKDSFLAPEPYAFYEIAIQGDDGTKTYTIDGMRNDYLRGTLLFESDKVYTLQYHNIDGLESYNILQYGPEIPALLATASNMIGEAEAWAIGTRNGVEVKNDDPAYQHNAKYYANQMYGVLDEKADKMDTVLETTLSRGRKEGTTVGEGSFAFGQNVEASKAYAHAEGNNTQAIGNASHAEGRGTVASKQSAHAEGDYTTASGGYSHAEGSSTTASGSFSHAEGSDSKAIGNSSHAEGDMTQAAGAGSHAEGNETKAIGDHSRAGGNETEARGRYSFAIGTGTIASQTSMTAIGAYNKEGVFYSGWVAGRQYAVGDIVLREGLGWACIEQNSDNEFDYSKWKILPMSGDTAFAVGNGTKSVRSNAFEVHWDGEGIFAGDVYANGNKKLIGEDTIGGYLSDKADKANPVFTGSISLGRKEDVAVGDASTAVGNENEATGKYSLAIGSNNIVSGNNASAIGGSNAVQGSYGAALGIQNKVTAINGGFAVGRKNIVNGEFATAFGTNNTASGTSSIAVGNVSQAIGNYSAAFGRSNSNLPYMFSCGLYNESGELFPEWVSGTAYKIGDVVRLGGTYRGAYVCKTANSDTQFNVRKWDEIEFEGKQIFVVGMGHGQNAFEVQWDGTVVAAGNIYAGGSQKVATEAYVEQQIEAVPEFSQAQMSLLLDEILA